MTSQIVTILPLLGTEVLEYWGNCHSHLGGRGWEGNSCTSYLAPNLQERSTRATSNVCFNSFSIDPSVILTKTNQKIVLLTLNVKWASIYEKPRSYEKN